MFGIGMPEIILILVVGLIVFGPGKLPEMGRTLGKGLREVKKASNMLTQAINAPDPPQPHPTGKTQPSDAQQGREAETSTAAGATAQGVAAESATAAAATPTAATTETAQAATETAQGAAAEPAQEAPAYVPPTQESVRAAIDAKQQKNEQEKTEG